MIRSKDTRGREIIFILMVHWMSILAQSTTYYQRAYSGYLFTIPGVTDVKYRTQSDAQNWCVGNGSSLLEISNATVQNSVVQFINDAISQSQLTGNNIITNGIQKELSAGWTWLTGTATSSFQISGQEGGQQFSYGYLKTNSSGYFAVADQPTTTKLYICEEKQTDCTNGFQTNGRCYRSFNDGRFSWYDSRNRCLDRGGDLASFEWMTTSQQLNALNGSWLTSPESYWIGLRRQSWTWQFSKTDVKYSQWSIGHPIYDQNQQCICLIPNNPIYDWKWSECYCNPSYQFVCISAAPSSSPSISSTSTTTQSVSSSSILANFATSTAKGYSSTSSASSPSNNSNVAAVNSLAIGLGVGLGGGFLIAIIIVAVVLALKYNIHKRFSRRKLPPTATVTRTEETHYATVQPKKQPAEGSSCTHNTDPSNNSSAEYAPITIRGAKTATIAPPNPTAAAGYSVL